MLHVLSKQSLHVHSEHVCTLHTMCTKLLVQLDDLSHRTKRRLSVPQLLGSCPWTLTS